MDTLDNRLDKARKLIEEGDFFRILTHYDVDGVCSAGIVALYLQEKGKKFHISFFRNMNRDEILKIVKNEEYVIITDMGSALINELDGKVIILDHHQPPGDSDKVIHINPHLFGYDGAIEATATTMAYLLADNEEYAHCFLAGILGDKQYLQNIGPVGLNKEIINKIKIEPQFDITLFGNIGDALFYSVEPFYVGLSGNREGVKKSLNMLGIDPGKNITDLTDEEKVRLGSYLSLNLVKHSKIPEAGKYIVDLDFKFGGSIRYLTELIDAACRTDNQSIAMAYILGEQENKERMEILRKDYRAEVIEEMYNMLDNLKETKYIQYFYTKSSYLASTVSSIATIYLLNPSKATLALHIDVDTISISARLHRSMSDKVNIGKIMNKAANVVGGRGGGHNVAAGANIPIDSEKQFLEIVDKEIEKCISSK